MLIRICMSIYTRAAPEHLFTIKKKLYLNINTPFMVIKWPSFFNLMIPTLNTATMFAPKYLIKYCLVNILNYHQMNYCDKLWNWFFSTSLFRMNSPTLNSETNLYWAPAAVEKVWKLTQAFFIFLIKTAQYLLKDH